MFWVKIRRGLAQGHWKSPAKFSEFIWGNYRSYHWAFSKEAVAAKITMYGLI